MSLRKKIFLATALAYIAFLIFPLFTSFSGLSISIVSVIAASVLIMLYPQALRSKTTLWLILYLFAFYILLTLRGHVVVNMGSLTGTQQIFVEIGFILPSYMIMSILLYLKDERLNKIITLSSLAMFLISFIYLIPLLSEYRTLLRGQDNNKLIGKGEISIQGLPTFSLMHAYIYIIPPILYAFKVFKGKLKWMSLIALLLFLYIIYATYTTTILIVAVLCVIASLIYRNKGKSNTIVSLLLAFFAFFFLYQTGAFNTILSDMNEIYEGTAVEVKISDFQNYMEGEELGGASIVGRDNAHQISWDSFFEDPLWGGGKAGDHSVLVDRLGTGGLFLFIPFIFLLITIAKIQFKGYKSPTTKFYYIMGLACVSIVMYSKGIFATEGWLCYCVLMPQMLLWIERNNNIINNKIRTKKKKVNTPKNIAN